MPRNQIKYKLIAKRYLKGDTYSDFIRHIFDNFDEKIAKILANSFIGHLGKKYSKHDKGFICSDYETVLCCWTQAMREKKTLSINSCKGTYILREQQCERLFQDNTSVNRFIVSQSVLKTLKLINKCCDKDSILVSINTDGFHVINPCAILKQKKDVQFDTSCVGKAFLTDSKVNNIERHYRENIDITEFKQTHGKGCIYTGIPGAGKTHRLCKMIMECDNPIVLSFTNKAIQNCKSRLVDNGYKDINKICYTMDSYFATYNIDSLKDKTVFIEEFSMIPNKFMSMLYNAYIKYDLTIYMYGDHNQTSPVESDSIILHDYTKSHAMHQMCPNRVELEYIKGLSRYDHRMNELLSSFLKTSTLKHKFKPINNTIMKHICYLNKTRKKITAQCCDLFTKDKDYKELSFRFNSSTELYKICKGMPVIATCNLKEHGIFNMMEFTLEDMDDKRFLINNTWLDKDVFTNSFIPGFCSTVYRYQGATIDESYTIHDVERMDKKQLYTALSRTSSIELIHLDNKKLNHHYKIRAGHDMEIINSHFNSNYRHGKIYKITFNNDKIYIGQTCDSLKNRLRWHLRNKKSCMHKYKDYDPQIHLVVNAPCHDKKSLERVESRYIHEYSIKYGDKLLNKLNNPARRKKIKYIANIETEKELNNRIASLEDKIKIKDDTVNQYLHYSININNKRYKTKSRYTTISREDTMNNILESKNKLVKRLIIELD